VTGDSELCNESHAAATIPSSTRNGSHRSADANITTRRRPPLNHERPNHDPATKRHDPVPTARGTPSRALSP